MAATRSGSKRPTCPSCSKPACLCLCIRIPTQGLQNKVSVTILQHSLERKHPLNSARIAKLGLRNVTVDTVSEINFDARFVIRLLEPGVQSSSDPKRWESSDFDQVLETKETQKRKLEEVDGFSSSREEDIGNSEFKRCVSNECVTEKGSSAMGIPCTLNEAMLGDDKTDVKHVMQEPVITAAIGKYGVISDLHNIWMPQIQWRKRPNFDQILASQVVVDDLEKGFTVKKLQKRQLNGSVKLEEYEEFELRIPSGSVLLYPSDKAVGVDDLKAMNFEVKNLIVLDGTWSKAGRLYNENPWLRVLPHLKLDLDKLSLYSEVRHQPKAGCLSTIESIVYALKALGDNPEGLDNLLDVFESMVADQRRCKDERLNKLSPMKKINLLIGYCEPKWFSLFGPGWLDRKWTGTAISAPIPSQMEVDLEREKEEQNQIIRDLLVERRWRIWWSGFDIAITPGKSIKLLIFISESNHLLVGYLSFWIGNM